MDKEIYNGQKIEDLAVAWRYSENGTYWWSWTVDFDGHKKAKELGFQIEYAIPFNEVMKGENNE